MRILGTTISRWYLLLFVPITLLIGAVVFIHNPNPGSGSDGETSTAARCAIPPKKTVPATTQQVIFAVNAEQAKHQVPVAQQGQWTILVQRDIVDPDTGAHISTGEAVSSFDSQLCGFTGGIDYHNTKKSDMGKRLIAGHADHVQLTMPDGSVTDDSFYCISDHPLAAAINSEGGITLTGTCDRKWSMS